MRKYSEGDVSAILRQCQPPVDSNVVDKDGESERRIPNEIGRLFRGPSEKSIAQSRKALRSSGSEESFNASNGLKRKKRDREVSDSGNRDDYDGINPPTATDLTFKKRKTPTEKLVKNGCTGHPSSPDNENQTDETANKKLKVGTPRECKKVCANNANEFKNLRNEFSKNFEYAKRFKRRNEISNDSDKSEFTIFVGNLPLSYDHKKVVKIFSRFGEVENARIRCAPVANPSINKKTSVITKKFHPNRNSAVAYVVFKSKESVMKATAENGTILNGHHLRIDSAIPQKRDAKKCVFVGSLPFDIKDDELWDLFKDCGEIDGVRVIRDKNVSMGKGFGYINFKSSASVELALKLNGKEIRNQKINVERFVQKKRKRNGLTGPLVNGMQRKRQNENTRSSVHGRKTKKKSCANEFQGRVAQKKSKKKKSNRTKDAIRKNRIRSILVSSTTCDKDKMRTGVKC